MSICLDDFVAKLPEDQQQAIKKRSAELIAEEATSRRIPEPEHSPSRPALP